MIFQPVVHNLSVRISLIVGLILGIVLGKFVRDWISLSVIIIASIYAGWLTYLEHHSMKRLVTPTSTAIEPDKPWPRQ